MPTKAERKAAALAAKTAKSEPTTPIVETPAVTETPATSEPTTPIVETPATETPAPATETPAVAKSAAVIEAEAKAAYKAKLKELRAERDSELEKAKAAKGPGKSRGDKGNASYAVRAMFLSDMSLKPAAIEKALKPKFADIKLITVSALCSDARAVFEVLNDLGKIVKPTEQKAEAQAAGTSQS